MLKLPKGLKKKKKGKKSKKDKELFTEEELEQYKREHQKQSTEVEEVQSQYQTTEEQSVGDEEWSKFKALTAGVDSIVTKTQTDLDRIKSTSFFQRVQTPSEKRIKEDAKKVALEEEIRKSKALETPSPVKEEDYLAGAVVELSESESEEEDADDIFDTTYIDVIASGEVGLIPESPIEEYFDGPDPFDTTYAEKIIKGPEVSKRGKKLVYIGSAVEVLTGRAESSVSSTSTSRRPRRGPVDLLLENFDSSDNFECSDIAATTEPIKTLLDDFCEIPNGPIDLSVSLHLALQKEQKKEETVEAYNSIVDDFDVLRTKEHKVEEDDDDDDEFGQLAAESLNKKEDIKVFKPQVQGDLTSDWASFGQSKKVPPPRPSSGPHIESKEIKEFDIDDDESLNEDEIDPFDTAYVDNVLPILDDEFDPRAEEKKEVSLFEQDLFSESSTTHIPLATQQPDLLRGSNTDLSQILPIPITSATFSKCEELEIDPFDTSTVESIVAPGKQELKFLEKELLSDCGLKHSLSDPEFDPRAEEEIVPVVTIETTAQRKSSLSLQIQAGASKLVQFRSDLPDLLKTDHNDGGKHQKPLTPYYSKSSILTDTPVEEDPFDTSFVADCKPTDIELNLIEKDLLSQIKLTHSLSDPDFDPRAETPRPVIVPEQSQNQTTDYLFVDDIIDSKVLTPNLEKGASLEYCDPFDTSIAVNIQPGQTELKLLESELLPKFAPTGTTLDILVDSQDGVFGAKLLTPQFSISFEEEERDPFDTSFASNLAPGIAETKQLETEFIEKY